MDITKNTLTDREGCRIGSYLTIPERIRTADHSIGRFVGLAESAPLLEIDHEVPGSAISNLYIYLQH